MYVPSQLLLVAPATPSQQFPSQWAYVSADDSVATISASGYFALDSHTMTNNAYALQLNDLISVVAADGFANLRVSAIVPAVQTVAAVSVNAVISASATVSPGSMLMFPVRAAAGVTNSITLTMKQAVRVVDFHGINLAVGGAGDTLQLKNGVTALSNALDMSGADGSLVRASSLATAVRSVAAGGTLVVTKTAGAGVQAIDAIIVVQAI